ESIRLNLAFSSWVNGIWYFSDINSSMRTRVWGPVIPKNSLPPSPTVIMPKLSSGTLIWVTDAGVSTGNGSGCRAVAVNTKNVSKRNDTSHMAVMSIVVLALFTFALAIIYTL